MSKTDDLFQQRLEQFENGASLAECLSGLPPEEAALLQLAVQLREFEAPSPAAANIAAQLPLCWRSLTHRTSKPHWPDFGSF
ncbi:MAG: hypothetical protein M5U34_32655 [Chloroflexi bacterium]|nr:hypothetical protein [Chloroflexota bacterium]